MKKDACYLFDTSESPYKQIFVFLHGLLAVQTKYLIIVRAPVCDFMGNSSNPLGEEFELRSETVFSVRISTLDANPVQFVITDKPGNPHWILLTGASYRLQPHKEQNDRTAKNRKRVWYTGLF